MYKHLVFALLASLVLISRANADVTFITSCPFTITQPGQYHLAQDLTCAGVQAGIDVLANDVELHFDGHTLTGSGPGTSLFGVITGSGVTNLSIHGDGTITGFVIGIGLINNSGALIVNITTNRNQTCIAIVQGGSGNTLISNTANGCFGGIVLEETNNNTVRANKTDGNGIGIFVTAGSTGNLLQANQAHNNTIVDLRDDNPGPPCANTWKSNHFETSVGAGAICIH
jgi:parallel beta-helix repeat protein